MTKNDFLLRTISALAASANLTEEYEDENRLIAAIDRVTDAADYLVNKVEEDYGSDIFD